MTTCSDFENNLRESLSKVHPFIEENHLDLLHFVSTVCLEHGVAEGVKNLTDLFHALEAKYSPEQACAVLKEMLTMVDVKDDYVKRLPSVDVDEAFNTGNPASLATFPDFSFQKKVIKVIKKLGDDWRQLSNRFTDEERGTATGNIHSAPQLFMCLLKMNRISQKQKDKSYEFLASKLVDIGRNDIAEYVHPGSTSAAQSVVIQGTGNLDEDATAQRQAPPTPDNVSTSDTNDGTSDGSKKDTESLNSLQPLMDSIQIAHSGRTNPKKKIHKGLCCGLSTCTIVLGLVVCFILTVVYATKYGNHTSSASVCNWAYLATGAAIDACFFHTASLSVKPATGYNISVCEVECHSGFPPQSELVVSTHVCEDNYTFGPMSSRAQVYFARFRKGSFNNAVALNVGLYLLRDSTILIQPDLSDLSVELSLYLFNDVKACDDFYVGGKADHQHLVKSYPMAFSNGTMEFFTVVRQDGFYCALWRVESPTNTSFTLNYTSYVNRTSFDVDLYQENGQCQSYVDSSTSPGMTQVFEAKLRPDRFAYACSSSNICLIVSHYNSHPCGQQAVIIDTTVKPYMFPNNFQSAPPFTAGLILVLACIILGVITLGYLSWLCWNKNRNSNTQATDPSHHDHRQNSQL